MTSKEENINISLIALENGDQSVFAKIYDEYWEQLYAIGYNRLKSPADVEDIIQELFTDLWNSRKSIKIKSNLKVYLFTAMKYKVIDHIRKQKIDSVNIEESNVLSIFSSESTDQILSFNELYARLEESIENLPEKSRLVFKMSRELEMSAAEIAKELKVSKRTVETQIYKSLRALKKDFSDYSLTIIAVLLLM